MDSMARLNVLKVGEQEAMLALLGLPLGQWPHRKVQWVWKISISGAIAKLLWYENELVREHSR